MNEAEPSSLFEMINTATQVKEVILADAVFDASYLFDAAARRGSTLVAAIRKDRLNSQLRPNRSSPERIAAVNNWEQSVSQIL